VSSRRAFLLVSLTLSVEAGATSARTAWIERVTGPVGRTGGQVLGKVWVYLSGRVNDAIDMVEMDVGFGVGAKAGLEAALVRIGAGTLQSQRFGFDGRQAGAWTEQNVMFGIFPISLLFAPFELARNQGDVWEGLAAGGFELGTSGTERIRRGNFATTAVLYQEAVAVGPVHERPGDIASVGGEVFLGFLGVRARLKPVEALDFLTSFFGLDLDPMLAHPSAEGTRR